MCIQDFFFLKNRTGQPQLLYRHPGLCGSSVVILLLFVWKYFVILLVFMILVLYMLQYVVHLYMYVSP